MRFKIWHLFALTTLSAFLIFPTLRMYDSVQRWLQPVEPNSTLIMTVVPRIIIQEEEEVVNIGPIGS